MAGIDWEWGKVDFSGVVAGARIKQIMRRSSNSEISIQLYDFQKGQVSTFLKDRAGKETKPNHEVRFMPITRKKHYPKIRWGDSVMENAYIHDGTATMSILDIYLAVSKLGIEDPHTLEELSFFSHAYRTGPSIVNSYEFVRVVSGHGSPTATLIEGHEGRDPFDRDPRAAKDFSELMEGERLRGMRKAFAPTGMGWIWGCNDDSRALITIQKTVAAPNFSWVGMPDDREISFSYTKAEATTAYADDPTGNFFPPSSSILTFKRTFKDVKKFMRALLRSTYPARLAVAANTKCYGALPGTFANYDKEPMTITNDRRTVMKFFKTFFRCELHPEYRYCLYDPAVLIKEAENEH